MRPREDLVAALAVFLGLAGLVCGVWGGFLISPGVGLMALGAALVMLGITLSE